MGHPRGLSARHRAGLDPRTVGVAAPRASRSSETTPCAAPDSACGAPPARLGGPALDERLFDRQRGAKWDAAHSPRSDRLLPSGGSSGSPNGHCFGRAFGPQVSQGAEGPTDAEHPSSGSSKGKEAEGPAARPLRRATRGASLSARSRPNLDFSTEASALRIAGSLYRGLRDRRLPRRCGLGGAPHTLRG